MDAGPTSASSCGRAIEVRCSAPKSRGVRIVVCGTPASAKSTLVADFAARTSGRTRDDFAWAVSLRGVHGCALRPATLPHSVRRPPQPHGHAIRR